MLGFLKKTNAWQKLEKDLYLSLIKKIKSFKTHPMNAPEGGKPYPIRKYVEFEGIAKLAERELLSEKEQQQLLNWINKRIQTYQRLPLNEAKPTDTEYDHLREAIELWRSLLTKCGRHLADHVAFLTKLEANLDGIVKEEDKSQIPEVTKPRHRSNAVSKIVDAENALSGDRSDGLSSSEPSYEPSIRSQKGDQESYDADQVEITCSNEFSKFKGMRATEVGTNEEMNRFTIRVNREDGKSEHLVMGREQFKRLRRSEITKEMSAELPAPEAKDEDNSSSVEGPVPTALPQMAYRPKTEGKDLADANISDSSHHSDSSHTRRLKENTFEDNECSGFAIIIFVLGLILCFLFLRFVKSFQKRSVPRRTECDEKITDALNMV